MFGFSTGDIIKKIAGAISIIVDIFLVVIFFFFLDLGENFVLLGLGILLIGGVVSFIIFCLLYGLGEMIENISNINSNIFKWKTNWEKLTYLEYIKSKNEITEEEYNKEKLKIIGIFKYR